MGGGVVSSTSFPAIVYARWLVQYPPVQLGMPTPDAVGWRSRRHPTASLFRISLVRGVLHPPVTKEIPSIGGGCNTPPTMG